MRRSKILQIDLSASQAPEMDSLFHGESSITAPSRAPFQTASSYQANKACEMGFKNKLKKLNQFKYNKALEHLDRLDLANSIKLHQQTKQLNQLAYKSVSISSDAMSPK